MEGVVVKLVKRRFDEETAKKEVAKVRIFEKEICGSISAEQQGKRESVDKRAEVRGGQLGPIEEHEEEDEQEARYVIAEGRRSSGGTVACLHSRTGHYRGGGLTFRSFELVCGTLAAASYTDYCRSCWPQAGPIFDVAEVNTDSDGISASSETSSNETEG